MAVRSRSHLAVWLAASMLGITLAQEHLTVPLIQVTRKGTAAQQAAHAIQKRAVGLTVASETLDGGFWFGSFDVGTAKNLSLLIDTGSQDVAVDPGLYNGSSASHDLSQSGNLLYATAEENGCGFANISYNTYSDIVAFGNLTSRNQTLGAVRSKPQTDNGTITTLPHQGIVGFSGVLANETQLGGTPFFQSLCNEGVVPECRFGLALGTNGTGTQILGGVQENLFENDLVETPVDPSEWTFQGGIAANGSVLQTNQTIIADSGTANIVGPPTVVRQLFDNLGIQAVEQNLPGCTSVLFGYYPCDKPPQVGITLGNGTQAFNVEPAAFEQANNGNNNCTAIVTGIDFGEAIWIVGQAFFQGKYVDFQQYLGNATIGVAPLKGYGNSTTTVSAPPAASSSATSAAQRTMDTVMLKALTATFAMVAIWLAIY